jgi:hypothetical protein
MAARRRSENGSAGEAGRLARAYLAMARQIAGPAAEGGDHRGSYEVWACTFRLLLATIQRGKDVKKALKDALDSTESLQSPDEQAEALRSAAEPFLVGEGAHPHITVGLDQPLRYIRQHIELAIQIGAPSYNAGDHRGCYEVYACTARLMVRVVEGADEAKGRLTRALNRCLELDDSNQQAWAMRHGFDDVLAGAFGAPVDAGEQVRSYLSGAIAIGAPAYDAGDHRGCYEVYVCTARLILHTVEGSEKAKQVLREALVECAPQIDVSEQAWILRRAFDRVLAGEESGE